MKNWKNIFAAITLSAFIAAPAIATTSSVNPTVPATNAPLSSSTIRNGIALPAYNDINTLFAASTSASLPPIANNTIMGNISGGTATPIGLTTSQIDTLLGLGTAAFVATGTSGATLPFANGVNTWSSLQTFSSGILAKGVATVNLNTGSLLTALTGTVIHEGNADTTISRDQLDAFGNSAHFSAVRADGTGASPTALQSADVIGSFNGWGYDGSALGAGGSYQIAASQTWTPSAHGTNVSLWTTPNGTTTPVQQVVVNNDGGVVVGSPTGGDKGAGTLNATALYLNGTLVSTTTGGGGSGTVNAGTTPDLGYYATSTAALSDAIGLQYNATTKGLNLNGVNAHSLPDNGLDTTGVAIGATALAAQTVTGSNNTAVGNNALHAVTTGLNNTAVGSQALAAAVTDSNITAFGTGALQNFNMGNTTTAGNTAVGYHALTALASTITATGNTAVGYNALANSTSGSSNTAVGTNALLNQNGGFGINTAVGTSAAKALTTGQQVTAIGQGACSSLTTGVSTVCLGDGTGVGNPSSAVFIGSGAGGTGVGSNQVVIGFSAGNASQGSNVIIGYQAAIPLGTGTNDVVIGTNAGQSVMTSAFSSIVIGSSADAALSSSTSGTAVGANTKFGTGDSGFGWKALGATSTNNNNSSAFGSRALTAVTTGVGNTAVGKDAGLLVTVGGSNTIIGTAVASTTLSTGSSNILIGTSSAVDAPASGTSNYLNIGNMIVGDKSKGILIFEGPTTALGSCGTSPTLKAGSNDMSGEITVGSTTASCVLNFANTHTAAPNCVVTSQSTLAAFTYSASTTALTIGATTLGGDVVDYFCPAASTSTNPTP